MIPSVPLTLLTILSLSLESVHALVNCGPNVNGKDYDLRELSGLRKVYSSEVKPPSTLNTTWYINVCEKLDKPEDVKHFCPDGTQACGVTVANVEGESPLELFAMPVLLETDDHRATFSNAVDGIVVKADGGVWGDANTNLRFSLHLRCPESGDGNENPTFVAFDQGQLRLEWTTSAACPLGGDRPPSDGKDGKDGKDGNDDKGEQKAGGWGFFTWLFVLLFLGTAGFIVVTAWVNYTQYGMSGVELFPNSDFLRDVPFLLRDFGRKIASTFTGGNRGGYSAV